MVCKLCKKDPEPFNSVPRLCAFDEYGMFTTDNFRCGSLEALRHIKEDSDHYAEDQNLYVYPFECMFIILSVYKRRGRTEQAVVIDNERSYPLTQPLVEDLLALYIKESKGGECGKS